MLENKKYIALLSDAFFRAIRSVSQVLCKPGSIKPLTKFTGQVYVLSKEEGGRTVGSGVVTEIYE